jgi:hypothetical protein
MAAPQELSAIANVMLAAPLPFVPAERRGQLVIIAVDVLRGPGRGRRGGSRATRRACAAVPLGEAPAAGQAALLRVVDARLLRKDFVIVSHEAKPWSGPVEGEEGEEE